MIENAELLPIVQNVKRWSEEGKQKIETVEKGLEQVRLEINELAGKRANVLGSVHTTKSVGELVAEDDGLADLRSSRVKHVRLGVEGFGLERKAAITSASVFAEPARDVEVFGPLARTFSVRDLLVTRPTTAAAVQYLRATRTGTAGVQVEQGDAKAEVALGFELHTANVVTIAAWVPASRQALDDVSMLLDYINVELLDALRLKEDEQLLKGTGAEGYVSGLWTNATAYNRRVAGDKPSDTLRRAITQVQLARGVASGVVINPVGLELLELDKDLEGRYLLSYVVTDENGRTSTWRVPVVVTDALGADEFMIGDFQRAARLYDRRQASVEIATEHADFFTRNLLAILAEERIALTVNRPALLVKGTFSSGA